MTLSVCDPFVPFMISGTMFLPLTCINMSKKKRKKTMFFFVRGNELQSFSKCFFGNLVRWTERRLHIKGSGQELCSDNCEPVLGGFVAHTWLICFPYYRWKTIWRPCTSTTMIKLVMYHSDYWVMCIFNKSSIQTRCLKNAIQWY